MIQPSATASPLPSTIPVCSMVHDPSPDFVLNSVLSHIDWAQVEATVRIQQANREKFNPTISVFRWWARRPHSLMGAIIDGTVQATGNRSLRVSDPFSGGGTVAIEAVRRGLRTYAQDLYPWPILGLSASIAPVDPEDFADAVGQLETHLAGLAARYRRTDGRFLSHILRVRIGHCPGCQQEHFLFPDHLVSQKSRTENEDRGFFGCQACGHIHEAALSTKEDSCPQCQHQHQTERALTHRTCPHCRGRFPHAEHLVGLSWLPILVQEPFKVGNQYRNKLRMIEPGDPVDDPLPLRMTAHLIGDGEQTQRMQQQGFTTWESLYSPRQLEVIDRALEFIPTLQVSRNIRERLTFAVIGLSEMPAYLCRWDRFHMKVFEGMANHRYAHTTVAMETNLLSPIGRGTLSRRLISAHKALDWRRMHVDGRRAAKCVSTDSVVTHGTGLTVAIGSSDRQALPDGCIDLALTDPPYFDDVQYGELARLFHHWLSRTRVLSAYDEHEEAVPNRSRQKGAEHYEDAIRGVLAETRRTLAADGRLILTFHNRKLEAWAALGRAIHRAGLRINALAVTHAENAADHSKRDGKGMLHDLVIECVRDDQTPSPIQIIHTNGSLEAQELVAVGLAMANTAADPKITVQDGFLATLRQQNQKNTRIS